ncbi:hypothetical protein E2562_004997 [Oryza meyeriana var. granulata]|uniref:Uncharacterized protein n=1 Tax=Oryza meyeriana var. granulata TaxID=110450 RepID=A0A6G1C4A3_9ORYZ|nr:hypothetical protein E2562_004997 [Oryza meyeriana var. granulata]
MVTGVRQMAAPSGGGRGEVEPGKKERMLAMAVLRGGSKGLQEAGNEGNLARIQAESSPTARRCVGSSGPEREVDCQWKNTDGSQGGASGK